MTGVEARHAAVENVAGRGPTLGQHDQRLFFAEARLTGEYGLTDGFALALTVPFKVIDSGFQFLDENGRPAALAVPSIHHRAETLTGFGDLWLVAHLSLPIAAWLVDVRFGVTLPAGQTTDDPFALGDLGLPHEHLQLGSGTVNPLVGVEARRAFRRFSAGGWLLALTPLYADAQGYRAGERFSAGASAQSPFGLARWLFQLGAEAQLELPEHWHGRVPPDDGNRGRLDVLVSAGAAFRLRDALQLYATVRVPVYVFADGAQLQYPLVGTLGITGWFDLAGEHDHHHHHHHEHEPVIARR